jgi:aminoglycoside phosphotransferase (APT) family kinase protein
MGMHPVQLVVAVPTVRRLVDSQFPKWSDLRIDAVRSPGTVSALFRIGDRLVARFPLQPDDPEEIRSWIESEAAAASELLGRTRFATPEPVAIGEPGAGYPLPWSVQSWIPGTTASESDAAESVGLGEDLVEFILGVRELDTRGRTFEGRGRGGDLRDHDEWMETCFVQSEGLLDVPRLRHFWSSMRLLPRSGLDVMNHGDLIATNVLVANGRITGVLDVGGLRSADPALDLLSAWNMLESGPRRTMRQLLDCDDLEWARGRAWAFQQAMGLVWYYSESNPTMSDMGRKTLERIIKEPL